MTQSAQCRGLRPLHAHSIAFDTERDPRASCAISDGLPRAFPSLVDVAVLSNLSDSLSDNRERELYPPQSLSTR